MPVRAWAPQAVLLAWALLALVVSPGAGQSLATSLSPGKLSVYSSIGPGLAYTARVQVAGSVPANYTLFFDSGAALTAFPCSSVPLARLPGSAACDWGSAIFNAGNLTAPATQEIATSTTCAALSPYTRSLPPNVTAPHTVCPYYFGYVAGQTAAGVVESLPLTFPGASPSAQPVPLMPAGCTGSVSVCLGLPAGVLAGGAAPTSLPAALGTTRIGWCLEDSLSTSNSSLLAVGAQASAGLLTSSTPLLSSVNALLQQPRSGYFVTVQSLAIGSTTVNSTSIPANQVMELATASPYLNVSSVVLQSLNDTLTAKRVGAVVEYEGLLCLDYSHQPTPTVDYLQVFPLITFVFSGGAAFEVGPEAYVQRQDGGTAAAGAVYCALVIPNANSGQPWRLGAPAMRGHWIEADMDKGVVRFSARNTECKNVQLQVPPMPPSTFQPPSPPPQRAPIQSLPPPPPPPGPTPAGSPPAPTAPSSGALVSPSGSLTALATSLALLMFAL